MIKLFVLDVDGTLTDGGVYMDGKGGEFKRFDIRDGMGIVRLRDAGVMIAFLSGRRSEATAQRALELGVEIVINGLPRSGTSGGPAGKLPVFEKLVSDLGLRSDEVAYMGDDVNDAECLLAAGLSFAPADGVDEAKAAADFTTVNGGGRGAVREAAEYILGLNRGAVPSVATGAPAGGRKLQPENSR